MRLVADVGGTNTRFGFADNGNLRAGTIRSFENEDFPEFSSVLDAYLSGIGGARFEEITVAVAGPVSNGKARLTNRDWHFDISELSSRYGTSRASLLNDLSALGHAAPFLDQGCLETVLKGKGRPECAGQSLVVGVGTGFNVSPVMRNGGTASCLNAEYGHVHLPLDIANQLAERLGSSARCFHSVEQVFSGRGFAEIYCLFTGKTPDLSLVISQEANPQENEFLSFYARLLALLTRNLMLAFLPTNGIFFAGGVARNLLATGAKTSFAEVFRQPFDLDSRLSAPVFTILDDAAALKGCARYPSYQ